MSGLIKVKIAKVPKGTAKSGRGTGGGTSAVIRYETPDNVEFAQRSAYAHHADEADKATMAERAKVADKLSAGASKDLDDRFLNKLKDDRSKGKVASDIGFEAGNFSSGVSGGMLGIDKTDGSSFAEVDDMRVRRKAYFETLTTMEATTLAGKHYLTPGGSIKCVGVEEVKNTGGDVTAYRCWFLSEQSGEKTDTKIIEGDQCISEMFNAKTGTANKVTNHRYWRLVTGVSNDAHTDDAGNHYGYIDLSATDCEPDSDIPQEGDVLAQFGNRTDVSRQGAIVLSAVDFDAPAIKMLAGIGSGDTAAEHYSLDGKDITAQGYDHTKGHAYMKVYGDTYIGAKDKSTYFNFDQDTKSLDIKAVVNILGGSTIEGELTLSSLIRVGYKQDGVLFKTMAGMNGAWIPELGGRTIAAWYGGPMADLFDKNGNRLNLAAGSYAASLDRMDGSGYKANGNFRWKADGTVNIGDETYGITLGSDGRIVLGNGISINIGGNAQGLGESIASVTELANKLSHLFIPYLGNSAKSWASIKTLSDYDSIKVNKSIWTDGFVSARGLNANGGTSGGSGKSYLSDLLDVDLDTLSSGQVLTWNGTKWVNSALTLPDMAGYALESWVEANFVTLDTAQTITGAKTFGASVTAARFVKSGGTSSQFLKADGSVDSNSYALSTEYVKKSGDTMTGLFTISAAYNGLINLNTTNASEIGMRFLISKADKGWVGYHPTYGTNLYNYKCNKYLAINDSGVPNLSGSTIWHAGNDGAGSGLDADLLDGHHMYDFMYQRIMYSRDYSIYDLRFNMGLYDKGDFPTGQYNAEYPTNYGVYLSIAPNDRNSSALMFIDSNYTGNDGHVYVNTRKAGNNHTQYDGWRILAYTTDNVASATKLLTSRTLWGQSFDGSGNVSGNISGVGSIVMNGHIEGATFIELKSATPYIDFHFNSDSGDYTSRIIEVESGKLAINGAIFANYNGAVGIGTLSPAAKLDVAGLVKASSGIQIGDTADIGWYISHPNMICAGGGIARAVGAGSLLVSGAWADATKVPAHGIYATGEIISSNSNAFRAAYGNYGAMLRMDDTNFYVLLTDSGSPYGTFNDLRPLYINLATGLVKMQQGLQIGGCTISWDAANNMLKFDKGLYSEGAVSARGVNANAGGSGTSSGDYMKKDASNAGPYAMGNLIVNTGLSQLSMPYDDELFICTDVQSGNTIAQKFPMTSLWKYIKTKADSNYATLDNVGLANLMWQVDEITDSIPSDDDMFAVADVGYAYDFCNKYHMSSLWQYIKSKMGLAFTVDGDNVNIGCQPGKLTLNGVTINTGSAVTCNSLTAQGVTAYGVLIGGTIADCVRIKYQGKTYTLQLAKMIEDGYLA